MNPSVIHESLIHLLSRLNRQHTHYKTPAANPWLPEHAGTHRAWSSSAIAWRRASRRTANA